jgi:dual specificity phosphatase 12
MIMTTYPKPALPLFQPTRNFTHHLELFEACDYKPRKDHPSVIKWTCSASIAVRTTSCDAPTLNTTASRILAGTESPGSCGRESPHPTGRTFDMNAFGEALTRIQQTRLVAEDDG